MSDLDSGVARTPMTKPEHETGKAKEEGGGLSAENRALHDGIWSEEYACSSRNYWKALNRLLDAAREEGREAALDADLQRRIQQDWADR